MAPVWTRVDTAPDLMEALYPAPDVVLAGDETPGLSPLDVLAVLMRRRIEAPLIIVSGRLDEESCVSALRMGAADYLLKDRLARLAPAVQIALANRRLAGEKRAAERREKRTASILRSVVEDAPAAISVKAADGSYLLANGEFERISGLAPGAVIGRLDADVFPFEQAREMTELDARCLHESVVVERAEVTDESSHLCVRYPMTDDGGEVFGVGSIRLDVTRFLLAQADAP
jgi:PAS domain S-box-containing protein